MIKQFQNAISANAHAEFQNWRRENLDGYFLNVKTKKTGIIHRSICRHPGGTEWQASEYGDLGKQLKVCSLNLNSLHQWASQNGFTKVTECADCKPFADEKIMDQIAETIFEEEEFNPELIIDERKKVLSDIVSRQGQPAFRKALFDAYGGCCVITDCNVSQVLEAAHICQYQGRETNHISNGLLLRADIHTLFDLKLIAIHPETLRICISPLLKDSSYMELNEKILREPADSKMKPSKLALRKHFDSTNIEEKE